MFESYTPENPYLIAEIGVNHEGSFELAASMIKDISISGAHCAKFQTYKADLIAAKDSPAYWDKTAEPTDTQHELFSAHDKFGSVEYQKLAEICCQNDVDFLSTPFDLLAVDALHPISKFYKIASADVTNIPLIRRIASKNKPVVMSTGAADLDEISYAVKQLEKYGAAEICLLHCVLNYPTAYENANMKFIQTLSKTFPELTIGYSDHVKPDESHSALIMALEYGACIIEKHFTHDKTLMGNDHYHSFDKHDLANFTALLHTRQLLRGSLEKNLELERDAISFARRSLHVNKNLPIGHVIVADDLICLRPGTGVSPIFFDEIVGKRLVNAMTEGQRLAKEDIEVEK